MTGCKSTKNALKCLKILQSPDMNPQPKYQIQVKSIEEIHRSIANVEEGLAKIKGTVKALLTAIAKSDDPKMTGPVREREVKGVEFFADFHIVLHDLSESVLLISKACDDLHKDQNLNVNDLADIVDKLKSSLQPFVDAQTTVNGLSSFIKKITPITNALVSAATAAAVVYATKG